MIERLIASEFERVARLRTHADAWIAHLQRHVIERELDKRIG